MDLIQNGYSCEYDMEIFINIFFKKKEKGFIMTNLTYENNKINVYVEIVFEGKSYFGDFWYPFFGDENNESIKKKNFVCSITKAFCNVAKNIRDVNLAWGVMSGIRPAKVVRQYFEDGYSYDEIKEILINLYDVCEEKAELAIEVSKNEKIILSEIKENSVSLYIGIPFCPTRCLYCSFVSTDIKKSGKYIEDFVRLLCEEIKETARVLKECNLFVQNIYIGGGTPTSITHIQLRKILKSINENIDLKNINEFTVEAGRPDTITLEKLKVLKQNGVNRISINPQTMNDVTLKKIGRCHTAELTKNAFKMARDEGFLNINMDLIAGLPDETPEMFFYSLDEVIKLNPENITVHSMCVKKAADLNVSNLELTKSKDMNRMLSYTQNKMKKTNRVPYYMYRQKNISGNLENVGYSTKETMSFYNINIMEEAQTIIALGGGGVTKVVMGDRIERIFNFKDPYEYINRFDEILEKKQEIINLYKGNKENG